MKSRRPTIAGLTKKLEQLALHAGELAAIAEVLAAESRSPCPVPGNLVERLIDHLWLTQCRVAALLGREITELIPEDSPLWADYRRRSP